MKIDVNQINVGDFVQINMKEAATSEIRRYVKEGEWYEVVDKDYSGAPLKIKFTEDFSFWVLECRILTYKKKEEVMKEEQIEWKVGDKFTIKSNYLGLLEGPATTETIFEVTGVFQDDCRVKFDSTEYGGWRDDGRYFDDIIKVEDGCEPIEKQEEKEEMEIKVGDFVKIKKEHFEYLFSCTKKRGGRCNVSQDVEYEVVEDYSQLDGTALIDFKDLDGDVVNSVYAHRFYKVSKKQEEREEMKSVERTAFDVDCHEQIKEKLNYLNLSQVAKDDILDLVELYVETVVVQMRTEFEQEIDQRYQEKLESLKKVLDI